MGGDLALTLQHVDLHFGLVVRDRGEDLRFSRGNRCVALDDLGEHPAAGLDAQRERRDIEQHHVLDFALQDPGLHRGAHPDHLVGVDLDAGGTAEDLLDDLLHLRSPCLASDEQDLVYLFLAHPGKLESLLARSAGALDQVLDEGLELCAGEAGGKMARAAIVGADER